jgi:hypothetical protein
MAALTIAVAAGPVLCASDVAFELVAVTIILIRQRQYTSDRARCYKRMCELSDSLTKAVECHYCGDPSVVL